MIPPSDSPVRRAWPPRDGAAFFWLWLVGDAVAAMYAQVETFTGWAVLMKNGPTLALVACYAVWQAWLLFCPGWRFAGWIASALIVDAAWEWAAVNRGMQTIWGDAGVWNLQLISLMVCSLLLIGARRRPWLLTFVGVAGTVLEIYGPDVADWPDVAACLLAITKAEPRIKMNDAVSAVTSGISLLIAGGTAAALAWLMPPVVAAVDERGEKAAKREA